MSVLAGIIAANRGGAAVGLPSYCTAHPEVLAAIFASYRGDSSPILIEATCNQVNQDGGYTGMTPAGFRVFVEAIATAQGVDSARIILGGDHLGPNPWRGGPAALAMAKARVMVADYVAAGFTKIHLDCSMRCADDGVLDEAEIARRAADLCAVAETGGQGLAYVIGTEVPVPGGEVSGHGGLVVTAPGAATATWAMHRDAFSDLGDAFSRVAAIVVQPGVDFSNTVVDRFQPEVAVGLSASVMGLTDMVFEAHSTDYQNVEALTALVTGHFAILKVGPELTYAYRQAVEALAAIEATMQPAMPSRMLAVIEAEMRADPVHWRGYIAEGEDLLSGLSDRVRYYWPKPAVQAALTRMRANIAAGVVAPDVVAQATGGVVTDAEPFGLVDRVVGAVVGRVVRRYRIAAGEVTV